MFFGIILPELFWRIYSTTQKILKKTETRNGMLLVIIGWIEQRNESTDASFEPDLHRDSSDSDIEIVCEEVADDL